MDGTSARHHATLMAVARGYQRSQALAVAAGELGYSVRTGGNALVHTLGTDVWEHRRRDPAQGELFDAAMRTMATSYAPGVLAAHDFGVYSVVADVGGGTGAMLAAILVAHPGLHGILAEQPDILSRAPAHLDAAGVADRVRLVECASSTRCPRAPTPM